MSSPAGSRYFLDKARLPFSKPNIFRNALLYIHQNLQGQDPESFGLSGEFTSAFVFSDLRTRHCI